MLEWGWGGPNSDEGTDTKVFMYFVAGWNIVGKRLNKIKKVGKNVKDEGCKHAEEKG